MSSESATRSVTETISETAVASGLMIYFSALPYWGVASSSGFHSAWVAAAKVGELLYGQLGWTLETYVTVLLAFYAVSIGGQFLGGTADAARVRRILGFIAELMAAAAVALVGLVSVYCWNTPDKWGIFVVVLPISGIIVFLAVHLGTFVVPDRAVRITLLRSARAADLARLRQLTWRSRRSYWQAWILNTVAISAVALGLTCLLGSVESPFALYVTYFLLTGVLLLAISCSLWQFRTSRELLSRISVWFLPAVLYFLAGSIAFATFFGEAPIRLQYPIGISDLTIILLTLATTFWPRTLSKRVLRDWTMHGASARASARTLARRYARSTREYRRLLGEVPIEPSSLLSRLARPYAR